MPGTPRDEFLRTVRQALGRGEPLSEPPPPPGGQPSLEEMEARGRAIQERLARERGRLMEALAGSAEREGWRVCRAATLEAAQEYLAALARERDARRVVRTAHPVLHRLEVDGVLADAGAQVAIMARSAGVTPEEARQRAADAELGITGVEYAIAELGACVLQPREGVSRIASLLPPVHVAVVEPSQIVETLGDVLALWSLDALRSGDPGSYLNVITGPSRTADIEQTLVVGVHGPQEVHLVLLET